MNIVLLVINARYEENNCIEYEETIKTKILINQRKISKKAKTVDKNFKPYTIARAKSSNYIALWSKNTWLAFGGLLVTTNLTDLCISRR